MLLLGAGLPLRYVRVNRTNELFAAYLYPNRLLYAIGHWSRSRFCQTGALPLPVRFLRMPFGKYP